MGVESKIVLTCKRLGFYLGFLYYERRQKVRTKIWRNYGASILGLTKLNSQI